MISIDDQTYQAIAAQLRDELTGKEFFNGQLEYDTEEFYSTLTCTLILRNDPDTGRLASATPCGGNTTCTNATAKCSPISAGAS